MSPANARQRVRRSLKVIERGVSMPSVRSSVAWALLLSSSAKTSAPLSTRAPTELERSHVGERQRDRPRVAANIRARAGLVEVEPARAARSALWNAARVRSKAANATPRRVSAANSGFCHSGCSWSTTRSTAAVVIAGSRNRLRVAPKQGRSGGPPARSPTKARARPGQRFDHAQSTVRR